MISDLLAETRIQGRIGGVRYLSALYTNGEGELESSLPLLVLGGGDVIEEEEGAEDRRNAMQGKVIAGEGTVSGGGKPLVA